MQKRNSPSGYSITLQIEFVRIQKKHLRLNNDFAVDVEFGV